MKRLLLQSVLAGALAFLLARLPLDYLTFEFSGAPVFLIPTAGADGLGLAASLSWAVAGAVTLLVLVVAPLARAGRRAWRAQDSWRDWETEQAASGGVARAANSGVWQPRANPYMAAARAQKAPRRARKIAVEGVRRSAPARRAR